MGLFTFCVPGLNGYDCLLFAFCFLRFTPATNRIKRDGKAIASESFARLSDATWKGELEKWAPLQEKKRKEGGKKVKRTSTSSGLTFLVPFLLPLSFLFLMKRTEKRRPFFSRSPSSPSPCEKSGKGRPKTLSLSTRYLGLFFGARSAMSTDSKFQRPVEYDPSLANKASGAGTATTPAKPVSKEQKLNSDLGLGGKHI